MCFIADTRGLPAGKSTGAGISIERPEGRGLIPEDTLECYQCIDRVFVAAVVEMCAVGANNMS